MWRCAIQFTYDSDCTYTWTVLLPCTVVRTLDVSCNFVNSHSFATTRFVSSLWSTSYNNIIGFELPIDLINYMHARTTHSPSASVEAEEGNPNSESSRKSKDRMSEEKKRGRSRPRLTPMRTPTPMVSWSAQLPTNQRQTKGLLLRLHRLRRNHP